MIELSTAAIKHCIGAHEISDVGINCKLHLEARAELDALLSKLNRYEQDDSGEEISALKNIITKLEAENAALREQLASAEQRGYELAMEIWVHSYPSYAEAIAAQKAKE